MKLQRTSLLTNVLVLYGILAAPLAWSAQLVFGYGIGEARCSPFGEQFTFDAELGELVLLAVVAAVAVSALVVSGLVALAGRRDRVVDDRGRVAFMATGGVLVSSIFIVLILLGGIASLAINHCQQG
jgi:predicted neutral ceramidase superfamily lipid hydrolase